MEKNELNKENEDILEKDVINDEVDDTEIDDSEDIKALLEMLEREAAAQLNETNKEKRKSIIERLKESLFEDDDEYVDDEYDEYEEYEGVDELEYKPIDYSAIFEPITDNNDKKPRFNKKNKKSKKHRIKSLLLTFFKGCLIGVLVVLAGYGVKSLVDVYILHNNTHDEPFVEVDPNKEVEEIIELTPRPENNGYTFESVAATMQDSVVGISIYNSENISPVSLGSGIILTEDGFIVTSSHVVAGSTLAKVTLNNGEVYNAQIVGSDAKTDLAVLKIDETGLKVPEFGKSSEMKLGAEVLALGTPGADLYGSITSGIISGLGRSISAQSNDGTIYTADNLLQTDASINPGFSGGALVNIYGQVIGINFSKMTDVSVEGICFAIPIEDAMPIIDNLIAYGYVKDRAILGVTIIAMSEATGFANNLPTKGLYISLISEQSNLNLYGISVGDVIITANNKTMEKNDDLLEIIEESKPGDKIVLEIWQSEKEETVTVEAVLMQAPKQN